ncbi:CopG family transcriptional regulator [Microbispora hainanensis]|uniref:CopG family transcriptional regulator n=1 Tax=Microbispora hainanensis TaxID=568844 RepID=A0A544XSW0_9ACTN|nr:CopG family transcriptional regulator [Microbispora hainanensis]TQS07583.1 CopG family transcriptional regulator [Microbispora hainanensis]
MGEPLRTDKMSITVPADVAAELRARAGQGNVSAYVTHALVRQLEHDRLGDMVADLGEIHGPVTDEELAAARAEWPSA